MRRNQRRSRIGLACMVSVSSLALLTVNGSALFGQALLRGDISLAQRQETPTYAKDIAPILQRSCLACHRLGGLAPMSLETYAEVRPWAPVIKDRVEKRIMPPWHLDKTVGIQDYRNDISLSDSEI